MNRRILFFLTLSLCIQNLKAQSIAEVDSLLKESNRTFYADPVFARNTAFKAKGIADALGYTKGVEGAIRLIGITHDIQGRTDSSKFYFEHYYELSLEAGDTDMITAALINLCMLHWNMGLFEEALNYGFESIKSAESNGNQILLSKCFNNVALIYQEINDYNKAVVYNKKAYEIRLSLDDSQGIVHSQNNLGICYKNLLKYDSAIYYYQRAKRLAREIGDLTTIAKVNNNLGVIAMNTKDYAKAEELLLEALSYDQNSLQNILASNSLAELSLKTGEYQQALGYAQSSQKLLAQMNNQDHREDVFNLLANSYAKNDMLDSAALYFNKLLIVKDSLFSEKSAKTYNDLQVSYQTEKKEQQIEIQNARLQRNQVLIIALLIILALAVTIFLILRRQMKRKQLIIKKDAELKLREAEINTVISSQEKERNRFARDLHDGFGQLISVLKLSLSDVARVDMKDADKRLEIYKNGESVINEMYEELRNICFDLMPQTLVKRGLTPALREFGDRLSQSESMTCKVLIFNNTARLIEIYEISIFRITQEWVNNILKYANAKHITIQLTKEDKELTLTIEDDGDGFEPKTFFEGSGNGWKNIQTRLKLINGDFDLDSRFGIKGSMVTVNVPLSQASYVPTSTEKEMTD